MFLFGVIILLFLGLGIIVFRGFLDSSSVQENNNLQVVVDNELNETVNKPTVFIKKENIGAEISPVYSLDQVSQHDNVSDCWLILNEKVYDVTNFIADKSHPGGTSILEGCGTDATEIFETRPMGSQTPHSERARALLSNFYIGDIQ